MQHNYPLEDEEEEYYDDDEVQCGFCGEGVHPDEEQSHIDILHKEEDEAIGMEIRIEQDYPAYKPPKYEAPQIPTFRNEAQENGKLTKEVQELNGAMNDLSDSAFKEIRSINKDIKKICENMSTFQSNCENLNNMQKSNNADMREDLVDINEKVDENSSELSKLIQTEINTAVNKIVDLGN